MTKTITMRAFNAADYDQAELSNLWHLSRTACCGSDCTRYKRILWASSEYAKAHSEVTSTGAYKMLDRMLEGVR